MPAFVNKGLLERNHPCPFVYLLSAVTFVLQTAESRSCDRDDLACKA